MRANTADRSFAALGVVALVPYALLGLYGCGFFSLLAFELASGGWSGLSDEGRDLRPAALLLGVITASTMVAAVSVQRQLTATRRLGAQIHDRRCDLPNQLVDAARAVRLLGHLDVVDDDAAYSFTYGLRSPRVVVSTGLVASAGPEELEAVLRHERYHLRKHDTIKLVAARAATSGFFFLPAIRHLAARYLVGRELAADRAAIRAVGQTALAGALTRALGGPAWTDLSATAAMSGGSLEHRVTQIETGHEPKLATTPRAAVIATVAGVLGLVAVFVVSVAAAGTDVLAMDGSMPDGWMGASTAVGVSLLCISAMAIVPAAMVTRGRRRH